MKEPDMEGVANHHGPVSCAGGGNIAREASIGVRTGQPLSSEITTLGAPTGLSGWEGHAGRRARRAKEQHAQRCGRPNPPCGPLARRYTGGHARGVDPRGPMSRPPRFTYAVDMRRRNGLRWNDLWSSAVTRTALIALSSATPCRVAGASLTPDRARPRSSKRLTTVAGRR